MPRSAPCSANQTGATVGSAVTGPGGALPLHAASASTSQIQPMQVRRLAPGSRPMRFSFFSQFACLGQEAPDGIGVLRPQVQRSLQRRFGKLPDLIGHADDFVPVFVDPFEGGFLARIAPGGRNRR